MKGRFLVPGKGIDPPLFREAAKFEALRHDFLQAVADYDSGFLLRILRSAAEEESYFRSGRIARYDIPCYTKWPYVPWRRCAVLAPCTLDSEAPYSTLKKLSANAWVFFPPEFKTVVLKWVFKNEDAFWNMHYQPWIWLLWLVSFHEHRISGQPPPSPDIENEVRVRAPSCVEIDPFIWSANLIVEWKLNTDSPSLPDWLDEEAMIPLNGSSAGRTPALTEPALEVELSGTTTTPPTVIVAVGSPGEAAPASQEPDQTKRDYNPDAYELVLPALSTHHQYHQDGSILKYDPISVAELERTYGISKATASRWFKDHFGCHRAYKVDCRRDKGRKLREILRKLNHDGPESWQSRADCPEPTAAEEEKPEDDRDE
jgi:hypothetical protein